MTDRWLRELVFARDPEALIRQRHAAAIDVARAAGAVESWRPGRPLRILLAGYVGASNTGADVRSGELIRQLRAVLGEDGVELAILAMRPCVPKLPGAVRVELSDGPPAQFVSETCDRYDAVIVCEGSLFTSTFSDHLAALLSACLGYAAAQGKLALAVGAEADRMTREVTAFVVRHCRDAVIFSRNEASRRSIAALGLDARRGTDTAWTFLPEPASPPHELLRGLGWDGRSDPVVVCPANPFWWPVKLDPRRALLLPLRGGDPDHYGGFAFHRGSTDVDRRFNAYLDALARGVAEHAKRHSVFPVVVGMEPLDRSACLGLAERLDAPAPLIAGDHDADTIVGLLRGAQRIVTTRLHAIILSMSAGVPSIGVAFDGRIPALMRDGGLSGLVLHAHDDALARRIGESLDRVAQHADGIGRRLRTVAGHQLRRQGEMGQALRREITRRHPDFPLPAVAPGWRGGLPSLDPELHALACEAGVEAEAL